MIEYDEDRENQRFQGVPFMTPMHMNNSNIVYMTSTEEEINEFARTLRGQILDENGKVIQIEDPLLNDEGVRKIIGMARSVATRISVMSNYDKEEIKDYMMRNGNALILLLMLGRNTYQIIGNSQAIRTLILEEFNNICHSTIKRGFQEGDKRFWKGSQQEIISRIETQQKKKGLLSSVLGWSRGES
jgi:hypothetical protein